MPALVKPGRTMISSRTVSKILFNSCMRRAVGSGLLLTATSLKHSEVDATDCSSPNSIVRLVSATGYHHTTATKGVVWDATVNNEGGHDMSDKNKALAARIPLEAFNQGRLEVIDEVIADNSVDHGELPPGLPPGK